MSDTRRPVPSAEEDVVRQNYEDVSRERDELRRRIDHMPTIPKWTTEPPTKPGFYWARVARGPGEVLGTIDIVRVSQHEGGLCLSIAGWGGNATVEDFDLWAGLIEAPPLPEDGES